MKHVLLVDDDRICNMLHSQSLLQSGLVGDIHTALNGHQAIELFNNYFLGSSSLPDIILLDLNMPIMDGFEFLRAFQMLPLPDKEKVKIIIVTSSQDPRDIEKAKKMGIKEFITKPLSEEQLIRALSSQF